MFHKPEACSHFFNTLFFSIISKKQTNTQFRPRQKKRGRASWANLADNKQPIRFDRSMQAENLDSQETQNLSLSPSLLSLCQFHPFSFISLSLQLCFSLLLKKKLQKKKNCEGHVTTKRNCLVSRHGCEHHIKKNIKNNTNPFFSPLL